MPPMENKKKGVVTAAFFFEHSEYVVKNLGELESMMEVFTRLGYPKSSNHPKKKSENDTRREKKEKKDVVYLVTPNTDLLESLREILKPTNNSLMNHEETDKEEMKRTSQMKTAWRIRSHAMTVIMHIMVKPAEGWK